MDLAIFPVSDYQVKCIRPPRNPKEPAMKRKKTHKNGAAPKKLPKWKRYLDDYRTDELSHLRFTTREDIDEAIGIVWGGRLDGMPFDLGPDGMSLIVPNLGIPFIVEADLNFTELAVSS
jgi:hypothetical protein